MVSTVLTVSQSSSSPQVAVSCVKSTDGHGIAIFGVDAYAGRQIRDRITSALAAMCITLPPGRYPVRIDPAVRCDDQGFDESELDLPIALAVLGAAGAIDPAELGRWIATGSLDRAGRIGAGPPSPVLVEQARLSGRPLIGGQGLASLEPGQRNIVICETLADVLAHFAPAPAAAPAPARPGLPAERDPPPVRRGLLSKLFGRVAEDSRPFDVSPRSLRRASREDAGEEGWSPDPFFHGNGHRKRLRARLIEGGPDALADYEVLEFLLFGARRKGDTKPIAKALMRRFGSLPAVLNASPEALMGVQGVGEASVGVIKIAAATANRMARASLRDLPVLSSISALIEYLTIDMAHLTRERVRVLYLDRKHKLVRDEHLSEGTIDEAGAYPREIIHHALDCGATGLILVHNHPSGDPEPSRDDIVLTNRVAEAGRLVGVTVLDHLIIGRHGHVSLRAKGLV